MEEKKAVLLAKDESGRERVVLEASGDAAEELVAEAKKANVDVLKDADALRSFPEKAQSEEFDSQERPDRLSVLAYELYRFTEELDNLWSSGKI